MKDGLRFTVYSLILVLLWCVAPCERCYGQRVITEATGTCSLTSSRDAHSTNYNLQSTAYNVEVTWVADPNGQVLASIDDLDAILTLAICDPGSPAPTDLYDLTIVDGYGVDALRGNGADLRDVTTESFWIPDATSGYHGFPMTGLQWVTVTGAGSGGSGGFKLVFE